MREGGGADGRSWVNPAQGCKESIPGWLSALDPIGWLGCCEKTVTSLHEDELVAGGAAQAIALAAMLDDDLSVRPHQVPAGDHARMLGLAVRRQHASEIDCHLRVYICN